VLPTRSFYFILEAKENPIFIFSKLALSRKARITFVTSVRPYLHLLEFISKDPTGRISVKFGIGNFYIKIPRENPQLGENHGKKYPALYVKTKVLMQAKLNRHKSVVFQ